MIDPKLEKAFTLVEILIVISIIAVVITVPIFSYGAISRNARDTRRMQDVDKVSGALQHYRNEVGTYPPATSYDDLATYLVPRYTSNLPTDPQGENATKTYTYEVYENGREYYLYATLEKKKGNYFEVYNNNSAGSRTITGTPVPPTAYISPGP